ncbi:ATPase, AAA-type, core, P-loop containing nucleoside triphosphate hydrolase [Artemisia annua]|uniref:ATPase, AAA-type, core, P-loop containing nucleoside triphosphate hydrolase n=1 Tax=Artemisia annua TaxID=35608 RepID=A0A2U1Q4S2_ARTAN|nr:ATPase, AAA-type, core, P-loop containing nucleoside triphosphate hydrolase [Artemisia annua]
MPTNTLVREVFRETVSLSPSRGMTVYDMPPSYPNPAGLGIAVGVVAMASNVFLTYPKMNTPYSQKPLFSRFQRKFSKIPMNHSLSMTRTKPISALMKEHKGFGGTMTCADFSRFGLVTNEKKWPLGKKIQCQAKNNNDPAAAPISKIYRFLAGSSLCIAIAIYSFGFQKQPGLCHTTVVPYSCLVDGIRDESVTQVQFVEDSPLIYYNTKPSVDQTAECSKIDLGRIALMKALSSKWQYQTRNTGDNMFQLIKMLKDQGITYGSEPNRVLLSASMKNALDFILNSNSTKNVLDFMIYSGPGCIMVLSSIMQFYVLSAQLDLGRLLKRKKRKEQSVTFADVEGVDYAKAELLEIVSCLNKDSNYVELGAKSPKGVLLTGPPGTGKTLLARALSREAGVSFFDTVGSGFVETFAGTGAKRVRELFEKARKSAPSIIFIDEIDAVGGKRGRTLNSESDSTLNQILAEMDGFNKDDNVVVIATTNRPDTLDPALLRPGRFTKKVVVNAPDQEGRRKIFALHLRNVPMQEDKEHICDYVASNTLGFVGAGLKEIVAESVRVTARRGGEFVTFDDILQALDRNKWSARANGIGPKRRAVQVTFADVEGVDDAKAELLEIVSCLDKDSKYTKLGAELPKGVLLTGPPGTGKTLLARALSREAGVSFFDVCGSEFVDTFVGVGARRVRDLFENARNGAPSIIFIDEIDAIGGKRGRDFNSESDNTLNQILAEMDGFNKDDNVVVIATTNRPDTLDPALLRPGRFSGEVVVNAPDQEGRRKIFALHLRNVPMQEDKEHICDYVASITEGFVGAGLKEIVRKSVLLAARRGGEFVTLDDILQALDRAKWSTRANGKGPRRRGAIQG